MCCSQELCAAGLPRLAPCCAAWVLALQPGSMWCLEGTGWGGQLRTALLGTACCWEVLGQARQLYAVLCGSWLQCRDPRSMGQSSQPSGAQFWTATPGPTQCSIEPARAGPIMLSSLGSPAIKLGWDGLGWLCAGLSVAAGYHVLHGQARPDQLHAALQRSCIAIGTCVVRSLPAWPSPSRHHMVPGCNAGIHAVWHRGGWAGPAARSSQLQCWDPHRASLTQ